MKLRELTAVLVGSPRKFSLESRLFNGASIAATIVSLFTVFMVPSVAEERLSILIVCCLGIASILLAGYVYCRITGRYLPMVIPFWIAAYLFCSLIWFNQAGSRGTVSYVSIAGSIVLYALTPGKRLRYFLVLANGIFFLTLILLEHYMPDSIIPYPTAEARLTDYLTTFIPSVLMIGFFTVYLVGNYQRVSAELHDRNLRIENLTSSLRRYLPAQLVRSLETQESTTATAPVRRRITVFFSDIKDFTPTTETMQPEDLTDLLNDYLTEMTAIATKWEGTIDKFVGDAMMVFFGAPDNRGDQIEAASCVQMAIEMQTKMAKLREKWFEMGIQTPLQIRVGINTGVAAVGAFGANERLSYTAIGGEVNLASRLEELCTPGGIVISHPTWALVKDVIKCVRRPNQVSVKGIGHELIIYDVLFGEDSLPSAVVPGNRHMR